VDFVAETQPICIGKNPAETSPVKDGVVCDLDPYVARVLAQEPVEIQRTLIGLLSILKSITRVKSYEQ